MKKYNESELNCFDGSIVILALLFAGILSIFFMNAIFITFLVCTCIIVLNGFFIVYPNQAVVISLFGKYSGIHTKEGLFWVSPLNKKQKVSTKKNITTLSLLCVDKMDKEYTMEVNFNWKVIDAAKALFETENYHDYILKYIPIVVQKIIHNHSLKISKEIHNKLQHSEIEGAIKDQLSSNLLSIGLEVSEINLVNIQAVKEYKNSEEYKEELINDTLDIVEEFLVEVQDREIIKLDEKDKTLFITNLITTLLNNKNKN